MEINQTIQTLIMGLAFLYQVLSDRRRASRTGSAAMMNWWTLLPRVAPLLVMVALAVIAWIPRWLPPLSSAEQWKATQVRWKFDTYQFETINGRKFINETVVLDGKRFVNCQFNNVTFEYDGTGPSSLLSNHLSGSLRFTSKNPASGAAMDLVLTLSREVQRQGLTLEFMP